MNLLGFGLLLVWIFLPLSVSQIPVDNAFGLSEADRIQNQYCDYKKQEDPDYECTIIRDPPQPQQPAKQTVNTFAGSDSNRNDFENETPNPDESDAGSIIIAVAFLFILPIVIYQVWKNHRSDRVYFRDSRNSSKREEQSHKKSKNDDEYRRQQQNREEENQRRAYERKAREEEERQQQEEHRRREEDREERRGRAEPNSSDDDLKKYYDILRISESATPSEIKTAYRKEVKVYHPDNFQNRTAEIQKDADEKTQEILNAYEKLKEAGRAD